MTIEQSIQQATEKILEEMRARLDAHLPAMASEVEAEARTAAEAKMDEATRAAAQAQARAENLTTAVAEAEARAAGEHAKAEASATEARGGERDREMACMERLLDAVRALDHATSLSDALTRLVESAARESGRAAVLLVRGDRLRGFRLIGFADPVPDVRTIDLPLTQAGIAGLAVRNMERAATSDAPGAAADLALPFASLEPDRVGLAVPVVVGRQIVAVLYADDSGEQDALVPSAWPEAIELLARHAARCLEVLTVTRAADAAGRTGSGEAAMSGTASETAADDEEGARRYARLLVSEIKLYHQPAVEEAWREHNVIGRLRGEIDRARRLYEEKIPPAVRAQADFFGQELVRTLAKGDPRLLGQET